VAGEGEAVNPADEIKKIAEEMRANAVRNMDKFRKKSGKPDRFKGAREYWHGYAQAAANLRLIADGYTRVMKNREEVKP
jgi:hypothetical protein